MKIYIVEETTWDHHEVVVVFESYKKAEKFCNKNYFKHQYFKDYWTNGHYDYSIREYIVY